MHCLKLAEKNGARIITLAGLAGLGKGELGKHISMALPELKPTIIVTSDVIKRLCNDPKSEIGEELRKNIATLKAETKNGIITKNLDDGIIIKAIDQATCEALKDGSRLIIWDGFPRTIPQSVEVVGSSVTIFQIAGTLDDSQLGARLRRLKSQRANMPCRNDDMPEHVNARYKVHRQQTIPMISFLREADFDMVVDILCSLPPEERLFEVVRVIAPDKIVSLKKRLGDPSDSLSTAIRELEDTKKQLLGGVEDVKVSVEPQKQARVVLATLETPINGYKGVYPVLVKTSAEPVLCRQ